MEIYALVGFVLSLSIYLGLELISKVPSTLHTPLMSGANAISGIALVGALVLSTDSNLQSAIAFLAVLFASINVFGGYLVTNRMLKMFKKK
jgi:NAD(P) transhydrogenase subunit alpha